VSAAATAVARWAPLLLAATLAWAGAWELDVDPSGGPARPRGARRRRPARPGATPVSSSTRSIGRVRVRYGDEALIGPDALLVTVTEDPGVDLDLLVHPEATGSRGA
jgi:hypothetical protein